MDVRAAVAFEANKPLEVTTVQLEGPKEGEVLIEVKATGICHTDEFTRSGADPEGIFPSILGHEGAGVVVDVGPGVRHLKKGDHVIPLYTAECRECEYCLHPKTNLCQKVRATQGQGLMPDGTSRFSINGKPLYHYMGCSTFANYTVLPEISLAKIREDAPFDKVCYIGCGVTTGIGAVIYTAKCEIGSNVAVFGLGGIGLNVIQGAKMAGCDKIIGVDLNEEKVELGEEVRDDALHQPGQGRPRQGGPGDHRPHQRRRRLLVRVHRQHDDHAPGAGVLPQGLGRIDHHRRGAGAARRSPPGRSSSSPAACGAARRSAARAAGRTCRRSSTGTWRGRSTSTISSPTRCRSTTSTRAST